MTAKLISLIAALNVAVQHLDRIAAALERIDSRPVPVRVVGRDGEPLLDGYMSERGDSDD